MDRRTTRVLANNLHDAAVLARRAHRYAIDTLGLRIPVGQFVGANLYLAASRLDGCGGMLRPWYQRAAVVAGALNYITITCAVILSPLLIWPWPLKVGALACAFLLSSTVIYLERRGQRRRNQLSLPQFDEPADRPPPGSTGHVMWHLRRIRAYIAAAQALLKPALRWLPEQHPVTGGTRRASRRTQAARLLHDTAALLGTRRAARCTRVTAHLHDAAALLDQADATIATYHDGLGALGDLQPNGDPA